MNPPRVSVLLPVRNAETTIDGAARSILGGTLADLELVAVDDGSTDGTRQVLERLAAEDPRVRIFSTRGEGIVAALGLGWRHCRADFVARMDADDVSYPDRLELTVRALEADPALAGVGTGVDILREDRPASPGLVAYARWISALNTPDHLARERFIESPLCHPAVTLRRAALEVEGLWREGPFPEDYELWLRLIARGWKLTNLPDRLFGWRDHDGRLTWTDPRYDRARHLALKAEYLALMLEPLGGRCIVWGAGPTGLKLARELRARGVHVTHFVDLHPRKVGQRIHDTPVISPSALGSYEGVHLIAAVGAFGARDEIRGMLHERGWREGEHFTCAA